VLWEIGWSRNSILLLVVAISVGLQVGLHMIPPVRAWFSLAPISWAMLAAVFATALIPVTVVEVGKLVRRARALTGAKG
jgi:hypothetical protein